MSKLKLLNILAENDRLVSKEDLTTLNLKKWSSMGLSPYYFNDNDDSDDFGMNLVTEIPEKSEFNVTEEIFLLSDQDMKKIKKLTDNTKNIISLQKEKIELMKEYIKSVASEMGRED